jgi:hypothetical protein
MKNKNLILVTILVVFVALFSARTYAHFITQAKAVNNNFSTAAVFATPTPTPTPTSAPTPTPTLSPCNPSINITNNGSIENNTYSLSNTGGNTSSGSGTITTGDASSIVTVNNNINTTINCH